MYLMIKKEKTIMLNETNKLKRKYGIDFSWLIKSK